MANSQILAETDRLGQSGRGGPGRADRDPSTRADVRPSSHFR
jgi:hypothetical protein